MKKYFLFVLLFADMSGKLIKSERLKEEKINVQSLLKGNYLLKIQTENGVVNSKFIKN